MLACLQDAVLLQPGDRRIVPTGLKLQIPPGYEGQVRPRSGLALKHGIGLLNSLGTIDSDYRGVVGVILFNYGKAPFTIYRGDRIAQLVIMKYEKAECVIQENLDKSKRESGGFGSTGI